MIADLRVDRLTVRHFRNIDAAELEPAARVNVIAGDNGQGKTSLLEAIYVLATSRSFRAETLAEVVQQFSEGAVVRGEIVEDGLRREQRAAIGITGRSFMMDGKRPPRLTSYATRTPVVVFHPGDLALVAGPASERRKLLDRVGLFVEPATADERSRYDRALRSRQVTLERRGPAAPELEALEAVMATHGARLSRARADIVGRIAQTIEPVFRRIIASETALHLRLVPGGSEDPEIIMRELAERRARDARSGRTGFGPQKDELELVMDGRVARRHASQGQQRILTLAIKIAELECVRDARQAHPILLLDDVSSELDPTRTGAVYDYLRQTPSQVFVTTTRPELFSTPGIGPGERADWTLVRGVVTRSR